MALESAGTETRKNGRTPVRSDFHLYAHDAGRGDHENRELALHSTQGALIKELERRLKVSDAVIKYMTVRVDEEIKRQQKLVAHREHRARRRPRKPAAAPAGPAAPAAGPAPEQQAAAS